MAVQNVADENTPLIEPSVTFSPGVEDTRSFKTRFWIIGLFSLFSCLSCWQWNTWGPISESVVTVFHDWDSSRVALMANLGTVMFVLSVWPVCWTVEWLGLRVSMLITCGLTTAALGLRCVSQDPTLFTYLNIVSSSVLGIAMTMVLAVPPLVAVDWFPPAERATAQAVMFATEQLGLLVSYLEPLIVRSPGPNVSTAAIKSDIFLLLYISVGCSVAMSLACYVYFPSKPPIPPSTVAAVDRIPLLQGVKMFLNKKSLWVVWLCYFLCTGPSFAWITVLDYSVLPLGIHQNEAMHVAGAAIIGSAAAAMLSGRYTDKNSGRLRLTLVFLLLLSSFSFYWFLLLSEGTLGFSMWQLYVSIIGGISLNFAAIPVFYELTQELAFPSPEVVVGGMLAFGDNMSATVFLMLYQVPGIGLRWVPFVLVFSCALATLPIFWIKVNYVRSELDSLLPTEDNNMVHG